MPTCRLHVAVQTRSDRSYAFANGRYRRRTLLVNQRRSWRRTDKVDEVSGGLRLPAATHGELTSGKHPSELEPALRPLLTFTCSPQRMIRAFGRCAGKGWLDEFGGQLLLSQCVSVMSIIDGLHEVGVSSCKSMDTSRKLDILTRRCARCSWWLAAQLAADRMRAVRMGCACLEAPPLPTSRTWHRSVECA